MKIISLIFIGLIFSLQTYASQLCSNLFYSPPPPKGWQSMAVQNPVLKVRWQGDYLSCWAVSTTTVVEMNAKNKKPYSFEFLYRNYLVSRVLESLYAEELEQFHWPLNFGERQHLKNSGAWELNDQKRSLTETGEFWKAIALMREFGLATEAEWPASNFSNTADKSQLVASINQALNDFINEKKNMQESLFSLGNINKLRDDYRKKVVALIDQSFGVGSLNQTLDSKVLKQRAKEQLGNQNTKVSRWVVDEAWDYRDEDYFDKETLTIFKDTGEKKVLTVENDIQTKPVQEILDYIKKSLDSGDHSAIYLSYNHPINELGHFLLADFVNHNRGTMSVPKKYKSQFVDRRESRHAVVVVGYSQDTEGHITGLKVVNSFGTEVGVDGHYFLTRNYLDKLMYEILFVNP